MVKAGRRCIRMGVAGAIASGLAVAALAAVPAVPAPFASASKHAKVVQKAKAATTTAPAAAAVPVPVPVPVAEQLDLCTTARSVPCVKVPLPKSLASLQALLANAVLIACPKLPSFGQNGFSLAQAYCFVDDFPGDPNPSADYYVFVGLTEVLAVDLHESRCEVSISSILGEQLPGTDLAGLIVTLENADCS